MNASSAAATVGKRTDGPGSPLARKPHSPTPYPMELPLQTSVARRLAAYIRGLTITQGAGEGGPFKLLPWQTRFINGAWSVEGDAALSVARGNGKSTLIAGVACAALDGPLQTPRADVVCVASSFTQGRVIYESVLAAMRAKGEDLEDRKRWRVQDSANVATIEHRESGARVRCIGSDPKRMHGLAPVLALLDEPAQWPPAQRDAMRAALSTGLGKVPGSRMIALGTRPADDSHWFARMLAAPGEDGFAQVHAAGDDDPIFNRRTWAKANPSLKVMPDLAARIQREAKEARADPALQPAFKALRLNMGTSDTERAVLLHAESWLRAEGDVPREGQLVFGVDLGGTAAMSAIAACWADSGRLECLAALPSIPTLAERERRDGVPEGLYTRCASEGTLCTLGGRTVPVEALLEIAVERFGRPAAIVCDRWRIGELVDSISALGLDVPLVSRGQGFKDGAEDVRRFRTAILDGMVRPTPSLLLRLAMREAVVVTDPAGNSKLAKATEGGRRRRARDDAVAAAILAAAHVHRFRDATKAISTAFWCEGDEDQAA